MKLIWCAACGRRFAEVAVACGWLYGARLPGSPSAPVHFADQDWRSPDRAAYMAALARHRPAVATVLDWERSGQLPEVLAWAGEAAAIVTEAVVLIPKVVGGIPDLPHEIGGRRVVLGYSVPTSYGGSPVPLWEHAGREVHLLGGSPQAQLRLASELGGCGATVVSADGNMAGQQARRGRTWLPTKGPRGHWHQLRDLGDDRDRPAEECLRRSLLAVRERWEERSLTSPP